jgi:hypothetical protein
MTKEFGSVEIGVEEGVVDLGSGIKLGISQYGVIGRELFYHSMLCKWTTSLQILYGSFCQ